MSFCRKCGNELEDESDFCTECGTNVKNNKRKTTSKRDFRNCPNCGASIKSFQTSCNYCHAEIFNIKTSKYLEQFSTGLAAIKSKPMPNYEGKDSLLKKIVGRDLKNENARAEFEMQFRIQKKEEIVNYIINYPVPNSIEDLTEFMILVTSNININNDLNDEEQKAWLKKMEQIYQKAKLSVNSNEEFKKINDIYISKKEEIKINNADKKFKIALGGVAWFVLIGLMLHPILTILLCCIALFIFLKYKGKINFGMKETKMLFSKIFKFIKNAYNIIKKIISKVIEWYSKLYNDTKKKVNISVAVIVLILLSLTIIPNIVNNNSAQNDITEQLNLYDYDVKKQKNIEVESENNSITKENIEKEESKNEKNAIDVSEEEMTTQSDLYVQEETEDEEIEKNKDIVIMIVLSEEYVGQNYKDIESQMKDLGFTNIKIEKKDTTDSKNKNNTIKEFSINGKTDYESGTRFNKSDQVKIVYWNLKKEELPDVLTVKNNDDLAALMKITNQTDDETISKFVNKYRGKKIKFDGCIALLMKHGSYKTRFDVALANGDYKAKRVYGPLFSFEDVSYYDMNVTGSDSVSEGMNFTITGKIIGYNYDGNYIELEPIALKKR